jgi:hypothetical protein
MNKVLGRTFFGSALRSAASSGLNLLTTIMVVRWFGAGVYANYIVDLAMISLMLIVLEVVPSNYSVFRIQDDLLWQRSIGAQIVVTVLLAAIVVFAAGHWTWLFKDNSLWMVVYAATLATKRYLDIRLQSSGRLSEFMGIELYTSALRLAFLASCFYLGVRDNEAVWASLGIAAVISQSLWWCQNPAELRTFSGVVDRKAWRALAESFPDYLPYYSGIALKRLKDNFVPLVAERLFTSRELLAAFLLAYRGVIFAVGQVRILEAMMNYRGVLAAAEKMSRLHRYLLATAAQALCLAASAGLLLSSGLDDLSWLSTLALSFMVWPIVFMVLERAKAYSAFQASRVNWSVVAYLCVAVAGALAVRFSDAATVTSFSLVLVVAEVAAFILIKSRSKGNDAKSH